MVEQQSPSRYMPVAGAVLLLARQSEIHAHYRVGQLFDRIWPSLMRGHYCLYTQANGRPLGFCNWMLISQQVLDEYLQDNREIVPADWDSGDIPFFPEMMATEGHLRRIIADLRDYMLSTKYPIAYSMRGGMLDKHGNRPQPRVFKWCARPKNFWETHKLPPIGDKNIRIL